MARLGFWARIGRFFGALMEGFLGHAEDSVSVENRLKSQINAMEVALEARADSAAFSMAVSDRTRNELKASVSEYEKYYRLAKSYADSGDHEKGKRSLLLAQRAEQEVSRLTEVLGVQQNDAEHQASEYARELNKVRERAKQIPALVSSARIAQAEKRFQDARSGHNIDADISSFDEIASDVELCRTQSLAKGQLKRDPHAEIEDEINRDAAQSTLDAEYEVLRSGQPGDEGSEELALIEHQPNPMEAARKLLGEPRYAEFVKTRTLNS